MSTKDSVIITDLMDTVVFVNRAFCDTYGYEEKDVVGKSSEMITVDGPLSNSWENLYQSFGGGELMAYHVRKDGSKFPVSLSVSVVKDEQGRASAYVGVARDMSDRISAEYELESINLKLTTGTRTVI
jgi:PAS domain S-box-containing protein